MSNTLVQTLKGFRDFLPAEKRARDFVLEKLLIVFKRYGFEPLETPTLEYASLLLGKYGDEADKLVYKFTDRGEREIALRYDQTVPTARVLAQYQQTLPRYFRRYQVQNVFRADKPQHGRYREFTQCDIDIFGSMHALADAEILACTYAGCKEVGFEQVELRVNDRQVLIETLQPFASEQVPVMSIIQTIDKLDKQTPEQVREELLAKGLEATASREVLEAIQIAQPSANLSEIIEAAKKLGVPETALVFTPTLARGLDYYTGMIFEITLPGFSTGSCGGGGRYDNLIEQLSGNAIPAVGVAFGFDRLVEAAQTMQLITTSALQPTEVLVALFDESSISSSLEAAMLLRMAGIRTEVNPAVDKIGKQCKYADQKNIPWVLLIGEQELSANQVVLKNMSSGEQITDNITAAIALVLQSRTT